MMESDGGASIADIRVRNGKRQSVFRSYVFPSLNRPNLTVLTNALVTRVIFNGKRATGVEIIYGGKIYCIRAVLEVVLSLGAIHTPKVLMQSGLGDQVELEKFGIPVLQHLPGVGQNFQDHIGFDCVWEHVEVFPPRNNMSEATVFWKSNPNLVVPDLQICLAEVPKASPENMTRFNPPASSWTLFCGILHPRSRGRLRLTGPNPDDPIQIEANTSHIQMI